MQIVFLDSAPVLYDGIDISPLKQMGILSLYPRTDIHLLKQRLRGANIVLTYNTPIDADAIYSCTSLKLICVLGNDFSLIDLESATAKNIQVCYIPDYASAEIAQHAIALLLELCSHVGYHYQKIRNGAWCSSQDFCWWEKPSLSLEGKTAGIIGCGAVGTAVSKLLNTFGMNVIGYDIHACNGFNGSIVPLKVLFSTSDIISLHCPLNSSSLCMINTESILSMKPGAIIINTASGKLVKESDVCAALINGSLGGYAADSLSTEPPSFHNPLLKAPNCVLSARSSCSSISARQRLIKQTAETVSAFILGKPLNSIL